MARIVDQEPPAKCRTVRYGSVDSPALDPPQALSAISVVFRTATPAPGRKTMKTGRDVTEGGFSG